MSGAPSPHKLAVVIPAFKADFLAKALSCLLQQTDQRFNIYIGDDASPADIQSITRAVLGNRPHIYKRFEDNLGGMSLAKHWNRCVAMANEPWIWLFSDDDLMDANCVEAFHKFLETEGESADLLRFEGWLVDENDKVMGPQAFDPDYESWLEFAYGYLMSWRWSFMQKLVFRRSAFEKAGGFLDLPLCLGTDDAAVIALGRQKIIRRIPGARVFWRNSRQNISPNRSIPTRTKKLRAACLLLQWLQKLLQSPREHLFEDDDAAFQRAMDRFLVQKIMTDGAFPAIANWNLLSHTRVQICRGSRWSLLKYIAVAAVNDGISAFCRTAKAVAGRSDK
jgi:glycosyltransferase involved in cell wall biosynthesis